MDRHAAFVRNIMIGREGMDRDVLLGAFERAGAVEPRSHISTGNVTFSAWPSDVQSIRTDVEAGIQAVLERREPVFIRRVDVLAALIEDDPFTRSPWPEAVEHVVSFTGDGTDTSRLDLPITSNRGDICLFAATQREVFGVARMVGGRTSGPGGLAERSLGELITTRSWSTVRRIAADPQVRRR